MHCCHTVNKRFWNYGKQQRRTKQVYLNAVLNILCYVYIPVMVVYLNVK